MGASYNAADILIQLLWALQGTAKRLYITKRHEPIVNFRDDNVLLHPDHRIVICKNARMEFVVGVKNATSTFKSGGSQYFLWAYYLDIYRQMPGYIANLRLLITDR